MIEVLRCPYPVTDREVVVGVSMGISCTLNAQPGGVKRPHNTTTDQALTHAKAALSQAKAVPKGSWLLYEPEEASALGSRINLEAELAVATEQQQFLVYYQPKASCRSGKITGFEACDSLAASVEGASAIR